MASVTTFFAPAVRSDIETIVAQVDRILRLENLRILLDNISDLTVILNSTRQIVFANSNFLKAINVETLVQVEGLRLGEALHCVHAQEPPSGCGTTEFCKTCGAAKAIMSAQKGSEDVQECRIITSGCGDALDWLVKTTPLRVDDALFILVAGKDISHEKRRRILERLFFHDIMNTAVGVRGLTNILGMASPEEQERFTKMISRGADKLIEEIRAQRDLAAAENKELKIALEDFDSLSLLHEMAELYRSHEAAGDRFVEVKKEAVSIPMRSSKVLLVRVLGNMIKNALEACQVKETVSMNCAQENEYALFEVHNPGFIPREEQLQIFQRSFSTKASDRGLGTYSMKLFSERYLRGSVSFSSSEEKGTVFTVRIPVRIETEQ